MKITKTNVDERLDLLENVDVDGVICDGCATSINEYAIVLAEDEEIAVFLCKDLPECKEQNCRQTHAKEATHALLIFEDTIPRPRAERIAKKIGRTIERFNRAMPRWTSSLKYRGNCST